MKIIVTGATGFIGRYYISCAKNDGNEYLCVVRKNSRHADIPSAANIKVQQINFSRKELEAAFYGTDVVVHIAGQLGGSGISEDMLEDGNRSLTQTIAQACVNSKVTQCVFISTPGVQGFGHRLCSETVPYAPRGLYEKSKVQAELALIEATHGSECRCTIIRPDFVYGPGDTRRVKLYRNIRDHRFILTTSGKSYLHPTHVADVVQGIRRVVGNPAAYQEIFNISAAQDMTVYAYLNTIAEYFGTRLIHINIGRKLSRLFAGCVEELYAHTGKEPFVSKNKIDFLSIDHSTSSEKAMKLLGYAPEYNFKDGFTDTMRWCGEHGLLS